MNHVILFKKYTYFWHFYFIERFTSKRYRRTFTALMWRFVNVFEFYKFKKNLIEKKWGERFKFHLWKNCCQLILKFCQRLTVKFIFQTLPFLTPTLCLRYENFILNFDLIFHSIVPLSIHWRFRYANLMLSRRSTRSEWSWFRN